MVGFLISIIVTAISLLIISKIPPIGVEVDNPIKALMGGAIIGAFSGLWSLFPQFFKTFTAVISLGLIPLIGSIIVFGLAAFLVEGFRLRHKLWSAILGAIALAIVNSVLFFLLDQFGIVSTAV
ncbi:MAG: phage holin family protein [Microcoleaceae cyanobacterium]